jgi:RNA polymerase sigma factor (TIGR02999 family)
MSDVTHLLEAAAAGDQQAAADLLPHVYEELRKLAAARMAAEKPGQTLQATALVHEAYVRLVQLAPGESPGANCQFANRAHFFAAAAEAMRRILVEQARRKKSIKGGGQHQRVEFNENQIAAPSPDVDLVALDDALDKLAGQDTRKAALVKLRYFAGLTLREAASVLGIAESTADADWAYAKSWLRVELADSQPN